jgi:hypothetical protein
VPLGENHSCGLGYVVVGGRCRTRGEALAVSVRFVILYNGVVVL